MEAKKCDRCGCFYDFNVYEHFKLESYKSFLFQKKIDLCKDCADDFEKWLKEARKG